MSFQATVKTRFFGLKKTKIRILEHCAQSLTCAQKRKKWTI